MERDHPKKEEMLEVLLHRKQLVDLDPEKGIERIRVVDEHINECEPCVNVLREDVHGY